ncbi:hypothetical protein [Salinisphaera sp. G21_0]|uniref:hypothetical protein n=1 Tax=Salinisphaera sp. G21_0 TaxID=2821094 RepID=UPI001AD9EA08|nr:hypothetical protein [Salinisphaera sp. G21_0]MBO9479897.1 hypothetical protein [Salinisphaera sp. G21_0]
MKIGAEFLREMNIDPEKFNKVSEHLDLAAACSREVKQAWFENKWSVETKKELRNLVNYLASAIDDGTEVKEDVKKALADRALQKAEAVSNKTETTKTAPDEKNEPAVVATKPVKPGNPGKLDPSRLAPYEKK